MESISFESIDLGDPNANIIAQVVGEKCDWIRGYEAKEIEESINCLALSYAEEMSNPDDNQELSDAIDSCYKEVICSHASLLCSDYTEYMKDEYGIDYTIEDGEDGEDAKIYDDKMWKYNMTHSLDPYKIQEIYLTREEDYFNIHL